MRSAMDTHGLTLRGAEYRTGIDHTTILNMRNGRVPGKGAVIDFAIGLGEDVNAWLELAGFEPIPGELVCPVLPDRVREDITRYLVDEAGLNKDDVEHMWTVIKQRAPKAAHLKPEETAEIPEHDQSSGKGTEE